MECNAQNDLFLRTVLALSELGVSGAKQQSVVYLLWKNGPTRWSVLVKALPKSWVSIQSQALVSKGIIEKESSVIGGKMAVKYRLSHDVEAYLEKQTNGQ